MGFIGVVLAFVFATLVVLGIVAVSILRIVTGRDGKGANDPEEARLMQELHQGLGRMEKRIEALETLLLEPERKDRR